MLKIARQGLLSLALMVAPLCSPLLYAEAPKSPAEAGTGAEPGITKACCSGDRHESTAIHSKFQSLNGPFRSGPEVTKACLFCHTEAAKQLQKTKHWTWNFRNPKTGQMLGKKNLLNNFLGAAIANYTFFLYFS